MLWILSISGNIVDIKHFSFEQLLLLIFTLSVTVPSQLKMYPTPPTPPKQLFHYPIEIVHMRNTHILIPLKLKVLSKLVKEEYNFFCIEYDRFHFNNTKNTPKY